MIVLINYYYIILLLLINVFFSRNRNIFRISLSVIETQVEVWENKNCWGTEHKLKGWFFPLQFPCKLLQLKCIYNSMVIKIKKEIWYKFQPSHNSIIVKTFEIVIIIIKKCCSWNNFKLWHFFINWSPGSLAL